MTSENGLSAADIGAVVNGGNRGMFGNSGFGGDGAWWLLILFLFAFMGGWNNNGNNGGFNGAFVPWMMGNQTGVQQGFDQAAIMGGLNGITAAVSNGFANAEVSRCNAQTNVLQALNNNQAATNASMNSLAMSLQNCCCENRAGIADLKYTVATENCADRAAINDGFRDMISAGNANTQAIMDKLCALELDGVKQNYENRIATMQTQMDNLQRQLQTANSTAFGTAQVARILSDNAAQTQALEQYLNPAPIPAYTVQNPNCCNGQWRTCGG